MDKMPRGLHAVVPATEELPAGVPADVYPLGVVLKTEVKVENVKVAIFNDEEVK